MTRRIGPATALALLGLGCAPSAPDGEAGGGRAVVASSVQAHSSSVQAHKGGPRPRGVSIEINDGDDFSDSRTLSLALTATDDVAVTQMCVSLANRRCFRWQPYSPTTTVRVARRAGRVALQAVFRDADGNRSQPIQDAVFIDSVAPENGSVSVAPVVGGLDLAAPCWLGLPPKTPRVR